MADKKVYAPEAPPSSRGKCIDETTHCAGQICGTRDKDAYGLGRRELERDGGPGANVIAHGSTIIRKLRNAIGSSLRARTVAGS